MSIVYKIKKIFPESIKQVYHYLLARFSAFIFGHPSDEMIVIGVTGTNGKSSTVLFIAQLLEALGETVGYTTTAGFGIAGKSIENKMKMTMPGRFYLQSILKKMVEAKCKYAVIETSSQGIAQFRHLGVNYDIAVFTNLTPEHIEAHKGFENYKKAKGKLFKHLTEMSDKIRDGEEILKISIVNDDDKNVNFFAGFPADRTIRFSWDNKCHGRDTICASYSKHGKDSVKICVNDIEMKLNLRAEYQHKNALTAISVLNALGFGLSEIANVSSQMKPLPGRFEKVEMGQDFDVIIDYAYEPFALKALIRAVKFLEPNHIIGVHGSAGGGRDVARRKKIGKFAGNEEDIVIVTNEDPYDEDPRMIIETVAEGAREAGKKDDKDLFLIDDRSEAIDFAISKARKGDVVIITGKGSEPVMAVAGGKKIQWSDRREAEKALKKVL